MELANLRPIVNWHSHTVTLFLESLQYTASQLSFFSKKKVPLLFSPTPGVALAEHVFADGLHFFTRTIC